MLKVGLILYSVRDEMTKDPIGACEKVADLGYKYFEVCNHTANTDCGCGFGIPAKELKDTFDKKGCSIVSAHIHPLAECDLKKVAQYELELGNTNIVNPMENFSSYDDMMRKIETFNRVGKELREEGITFFYHNHNHEFKTFNGKAIYDYIVENTDPSYVALELDTFWVMRAGLDPVAALKKYGKRIKLVHQKDFSFDAVMPINMVGLTPEEREFHEGEDFYGINKRIRPEEPEPSPEIMHKMNSDYASCFAEVGTGIMKIQNIINAADSFTQAEYLILEQDLTRMPSQMESVAKSMEAFRKFKNICGL